jgi:hypothetical protein
VESLHKHHGETEAVAIHRTIFDMAKEGWELVEACGDEIRMPSLIFKPLVAPCHYLVAAVPHAKGHKGVDDIRAALIDQHDQGWLVLTVLDNPLSPPVAVYKQTDMKSSEHTPKLAVLPISIIGSTADSIKKEVSQQQQRSNWRLCTIMNSGLSPVLIFLSNTGESDYEYHVEHASGGFFSGHERKLSDLINLRAKQGWQVCGAFEDESLLPCLVFYRASQQ